MPPISVVANVRGKKFDVTAESVEELTQKVEKLTGIDSSLQTVLFKGKVLGTQEKFDELGIASGDVLNVVKGRKSRVSTTEEVKASLSKPADASNSVNDEKINPPLPSDAPQMNFSPEDIQKAKEQMDQLFNSNFLEDFFASDERLEQSRLKLLDNLDKYEKMMPGFREQTEEIANDPAKWKEAMLAAKEQLLKIKQQRDLMNQNTK